MLWGPLQLGQNLMRQPIDSFCNQKKNDKVCFFQIWNDEGQINNLKNVVRKTFWAKIAVWHVLQFWYGWQNVLLRICVQNSNAAMVGYSSGSLTPKKDSFSNWWFVFKPVLPNRLRKLIFSINQFSFYFYPSTILAPAQNLLSDSQHLLIRNSLICRCFRFQDCNVNLRIPAHQGITNDSCPPQLTAIKMLSGFRRIG